MRMIEQGLQKALQLGERKSTKLLLRQAAWLPMNSILYTKEERIQLLQCRRTSRGAREHTQAGLCPSWANRRKFEWS
jgi:hypothetical protein